MTSRRNFKHQVRARSAKTGESYTSALRHFRAAPSESASPGSVRLAVAQSLVRNDPGDAEALRESGRGVRALMRVAAGQGARVVHFPEGAICFPDKRVMSVAGPGAVGPADWERCQWSVLRSELAAIAETARELRLWSVVSSAHRLTGPHRPHNSLYVISDRGEVVTRYDERLLSKTKVSYMYSPGRAPVTFDVDGVRFGCLLGMEIHFPELFAEYEGLGADCVLFSTSGTLGNTAAQAQGHAAVNSYWVSLAVPVQDGAATLSGIVAPNGDWLARCAAGGARRRWPSWTLTTVQRRLPRRLPTRAPGGGRRGRVCTPSTKWPTLAARTGRRLSSPSFRRVRWSGRRAVLVSGVGGASVPLVSVPFRSLREKARSEAWGGCWRGSEGTEGTQLPCSSHYACVCMRARETNHPILLLFTPCTPEPFITTDSQSLQSLASSRKTL
ncbi:carbon-nitrogen hydrolase family protein [Streptomyces sp. ATexAB-D23]|uniref:carbon-nitrogen hydrolase family protein n=1 Tax=unclassified Streptomyces TaxID=2593676 RepID=UPI002D218DB2|nr:carbon-nitrogen hydrolase family protein [Streptomyces sp. ATexAB-D23]